jgi:hypothetical protein
MFIRSFFKKAFLLFSIFFLTFALSLPVFAQNNSQHPVIWKTDYAKFAASDFSIRIGDKYFYGAEPVRVHSDPGTNQTTLELEWKENDVQMRMFMYFRMRDHGEWELYDLRTYNGKSTGDWIFYNPTDVLGNEISSIPGQHNFAAERRFKSKSNVDAEIYCKECGFSAFSTEPLKYSAQGYALELLTGLSSNETITLLDTGNTGYGVNALLRDNAREVVTNQAGLRYEWSSQNTNVVKVYPGDIEYAQGGCAYGIAPPCPMMNVQIAGIGQGVTTITVSVLRDSTVIASNMFDVKVISKANFPVPNPSSSPSPTSVPVMTPSPTSTDTSAENERLKKELEVLKGTVGEIQLDVANQREELNAVQKVLKAVSEFLTKVFTFSF